MKLNELVTILIPVKNEAANLPLCLDRIRQFDHVVVVDSGSTDETCRIAADYGREVVQFKWNGLFPKKRNWMLRNYSFKTPWVLFLDADERLSDKQVDELERVLPDTTHDALIMHLDNWFMGKILRHGDSPRKTNMLRLGTGEYERIDEQKWSQMDMEVNEHIIVRGTIGTLSCHLEHYDMRSLPSYFAKHNEYSSWEAHRFVEFTKDNDFSQQTWRQKIKYRFIYTNKLGPLFYFFVSYFLKGGFLDGAPGFYFIMNRLFYFYQIQEKIKLIQLGMLK